jgi:uncharacterized membrane protein YfcA
VNGAFGGGGGMIMVPLLSLCGAVDAKSVFPSSVAIMLPICITSVAVSALQSQLPLETALPYLLGGSIGGLAAGIWGKHVPVRWLHIGLGIMIIWGGIRYLC